MGDSKQDQQVEKLESLEQRVARVEKQLRILDSELNNKIRWIIKTAGISDNQDTIYDEGDDEDQFLPIRPGSRILQRQLPRKPQMAYHPPSRFIIPEVQYDDEEDEDEPLQDYTGNEKNDTMDAEYDCEDADADAVDETFYDESDGPDPLAEEMGDGGDANDTAEDQDRNEESVQNPWRFDGDEGNEQDDQEQDGEGEDDADLQEMLQVPGHFMDVSQPRSSDTSMTRRPNILRTKLRQPAAPFSNTFRLLQARNKANFLSKPGSRVIVPKNRYLMSSSLVSHLQQQKILSTVGTKLAAPRKPVLLTRPNPGASTPAMTSDTKEKVYYCDRCPLTFTLSTRHAHLELHKQMDLTKKQDGSPIKIKIKNKPLPSTSTSSSSSKSLLKPISSLSPPRRTRIRPRKVCPICTKSYSRNQYLRNHMDEHIAEYPHICKECFTVYGSEKELEDHCQASDKCFMSMYQP